MSLNTASILENIKKKINKIEQPRPKEEAVSGGDEFESIDGTESEDLEVNIHEKSAEKDAKQDVILEHEIENSFPDEAELSEGKAEDDHDASEAKVEEDSDDAFDIEAIDGDAELDLEDGAVLPEADVASGVGLDTDDDEFEVIPGTEALDESGLHSESVSSDDSEGAPDSGVAKKLSDVDSGEKGVSFDLDEVSEGSLEGLDDEAEVDLKEGLPEDAGLDGDDSEDIKFDGSDDSGVDEVAVNSDSDIDFEPEDEVKVSERSDKETVATDSEPSDEGVETEMSNSDDDLFEELDKEGGDISESKDESIELDDGGLDGGSKEEVASKSDESKSEEVKNLEEENDDLSEMLAEGDQKHQDLEVKSQVSSSEASSGTDDEDLFGEEVSAGIGSEASGSEAMISEDLAGKISDSVKGLSDAKGLADKIEGAGITEALPEMAKELMRPKLEEWFSNNLEQLVERVVREEIRRVINKND